MASIGGIQVADVPGRREPGPGRSTIPRFRAALDRLGYTGVVGLEAWASGDPVQALERIRTTFTVPALRLDRRARVPSERLGP